MKKLLVRLETLAEMLDVPYQTLKQNWRELPHVRITKGGNAKGARFYPPHVLEHLITKTGVNYGHIEIQDQEGDTVRSGVVDREQQSGRQGRIQDEEGGAKMVTRRLNRGGKKARIDLRFDAFANI